MRGSKAVLQRLKALGLVGFGLLLAGCVSEGPPSLAVIQPDFAVGTIVPIHVATTRAPINDPVLKFAGGRSAKLSFASVDVWVPNDRVPGSIAYPSDQPKPDKEFAITQFQPLTTASAFKNSVRSQLKALPPENRNILIFIHGYNVPYSAGVYRHAQIARDFGGVGVAIHYSWPSAGKAPAYLYDGDSAQFARDGLADLMALATDVGAREVVVLAHSMGTLVTMEALRTLSLKGDKSTLSDLGPLVLAAPDIDVDVFRRQLASLKPRPEPMVVFVSREDKALKISQRVRGGTSRIGAGAHVKELQEDGIIVLDLSTVEDGADRANHATFANSPTLISLIKSGAVESAVYEGSVQTTDASLVDSLTSILRLPINAVTARE